MLTFSQPPKRRQLPAVTAKEKQPRQSKLAKENQITASQESEIKEAFSLFSEQPSNSPEPVIPTLSVRRALIALGTPPSSAAELQELLETVDPDESGIVTYPHFVAIAALKLHNRSEESQREEVERAFLLFTGGSGEGRITIGALRRVARQLKEDVDEQVLKDMILEANGGEGMSMGVNMRDFEGVMRRAGVFR